MTTTTQTTEDTMTTKTTITGYVYDGDLMTYDTAEFIRRATSDESRESREAGSIGAIRCEVSSRTLRARCPRYVRAVRDAGKPYS